jgi:hypothetical protein
MAERSKTALITGASNGIGYELSKLFAADGYNLVLVARSAQKLNEVAVEFRETYRVNVVPLAKDLSLSSAVDEIWSTLRTQSITIDALVNSAGFGMHGPMAEDDLAEQLNMLQVNVVALTHLTRLCLPGMIERGFGQILNIGSTGSFAPGPSMAVYCATKAFVLSLSEAIHEELRGTGVSVTALCPGVTRTGFQARANVEKTRLVKSGSMTARQVAQSGYAALKRGTPVVVPGWWNWLTTFSIRFVPRSLSASMAKRMLESAGS